MKTLKLMGAAMLLTGILMTSCKKFDDGGKIKKAEKNIKNTWKLEAYDVGGTAVTSDLLIQSFTEVYNEDGSYIRTYSDSAGAAFSDTGTWALTSDNLMVNLNGVGGMMITDSITVDTISSVTILQLEKDEFKYSFSDNGLIHTISLDLD